VHEIVRPWNICHTCQHVYGVQGYTDVYLHRLCNTWHFRGACRKVSCRINFFALERQYDSAYFIKPSVIKQTTWYINLIRTFTIVGNIKSDNHRTVDNIIIIHIYKLYNIYRFILICTTNKINLKFFMCTSFKHL